MLGQNEKLGRLVHDVRHELGVDGLADSFPALDLDRVGLLDAVEHVLVPRRAVLGVLGVLVEDGVVVALGSNTPELTNLKKLEVRKQKKKNKKHTMRSIKVSSSIGGTSDIFISFFKEGSIRSCHKVIKLMKISEPKGSSSEARNGMSCGSNTWSQGHLA